MSGCSTRGSQKSCEGGSTRLGSTSPTAGLTAELLANSKLSCCLLVSSGAGSCLIGRVARQCTGLVAAGSSACLSFKPRCFSAIDLLAFANATTNCTFDCFVTVDRKSYCRFDLDCILGPRTMNYRSIVRAIDFFIGWQLVG